MVIGDDVAIVADHEAGPGLAHGLARLRGWGIWRRRRRCRGNRLRRDRELADIGDAVLLDAEDTVEQRRQQLRGLVQVELKQLSLRKGGHRLGLAKLTDERRIDRHLDIHQLRADRHAVDVECLLAVERQRERKGLAGHKSPAVMGEPQAPAAILADRDHEIDAALIGGAGRAMGERAVLVVGVGPALPVAHGDRAIGPAGKRCCGQQHAQGRNGGTNCNSHHALPPATTHHRRPQNSAASSKRIDCVSWVDVPILFQR